MSSSQEQFNKTKKPMSHRQPLPLGPNALKAIEAKNLTRDLAETFIGFTHPGGLIIGVTTSPGLSYPQGVYMTLTNEDKPATHIRVG